MARYAIWGSELSPYTLKLRALCDLARLHYAWLPADGSRLENAAAMWRIARAKRSRSAVRYPATGPLDEYPLVPFLLGEGRHVSYDSSALARWLDDHHPPPHGPLFPAEPALAFVARLIDEAFDEFGLYMVHHNRWTLSATTNDAGARLARELRRVRPPGTAAIVAGAFARRQVRRLPYLFSVAPPGFAIPGWPASLTPPGRAGFPPTHALLDDAWRAHLDVLEDLLSAQPYVLGARFTVADAAVYGQLGMNLADPSAHALMERRAPTVHRWLRAIHEGRHREDDGPLDLSPRLGPLIALIERTFVALMEQNARAYETVSAAGERRFNEAAFDAGRALYDGALLGRPFRHVVKTFQVQVWRELRAAWGGLAADARTAVGALVPDADALAAALA